MYNIECENCKTQGNVVDIEIGSWKVVITAICNNRDCEVEEFKTSYHSPSQEVIREEGSG